MGKKVLTASGGRGVGAGGKEFAMSDVWGRRIVVAGFAGLERNMEKVAMNRILLKGAVVLGYVRSFQWNQHGDGCADRTAEIW